MPFSARRTGHLSPGSTLSPKRVYRLLPAAMTQLSKTILLTLSPITTEPRSRGWNMTARQGNSYRSAAKAGKPSPWMKYRPPCQRCWPIPAKIRMPIYSLTPPSRWSPMKLPALQRSRQIHVSSQESVFPTDRKKYTLSPQQHWHPGYPSASTGRIKP